MQKLYTIRMASDLLHRHPNTIYPWITVDRLFPNAAHIRGGWFIPERDMRRVLKDGHPSRAADPLSD